MAEIYVKTVVKDGANVVLMTTSKQNNGYEVADLPADPNFAVIGSILVGRTLTAPPDPDPIHFTLGRIDIAYEYFVRRVRNPNWPDTAPTLATGQDALRGLNRNLYSGAAVCYPLATGAFLDSRGNAVTNAATIERAISHYEFMCSNYAPTWYRLILSDPDALSVVRPFPDQISIRPDGTDASELPPTLPPGLPPGLFRTLP